eukprot:gnl/Carplike_NY0171/6285_a8631_222.p1 GENE.gnl/Carplike_NY0171/6285_a8631_222~~gnl/Carplike_NY0171/6285_a8631_222.p1  ORF type:complete len:163 (-),score=7.54 gnl/Carplike_NY0171/6285_a8631_222:17-505(-)
MLKKILSNFSEDELLSFLPKEGVEFALSLSANEDDSSFEKEQLAEIVANTKEVEFIFNDELRQLLIDRLTTSLFNELFHEFGLDDHQVKPFHYQAAIDWAIENPYEFSKRIGLGTIFKSQLELDTTVESISNIEPAYPLYPYQQIISKKVLSSLSSEDRRGK